MTKQPKYPPFKWWPLLNRILVIIQGHRKETIPGLPAFNTLHIDQSLFQISTRYILKDNKSKLDIFTLVFLKCCYFSSPPQNHQYAITFEAKYNDTDAMGRVVKGHKSRIIWKKTMMLKKMTMMLKKGEKA